MRCKVCNSAWVAPGPSGGDCGDCGHENGTPGNPTDMQARDLRKRVADLEAENAALARILERRK